MCLCSCVRSAREIEGPIRLSPDDCSSDGSDGSGGHFHLNDVCMPLALSPSLTQSLSLSVSWPAIGGAQHSPLAFIIGLPAGRKPLRLVAIAGEVRMRRQIYREQTKNLNLAFALSLSRTLRASLSHHCAVAAALHRKRRSCSVSLSLPLFLSLYHSLRPANSRESSSAAEKLPPPFRLPLVPFTNTSVIASDFRMPPLPFPPLNNRHSPTTSHLFPLFFIIFFCVFFLFSIFFLFMILFGLFSSVLPSTSSPYLRLLNNSLPFC